MGIEFFGGSCPNCTNPVLGKLEPNSVGAFQFDACPSCGFIDFETSDKRGYDEISRNDRIDIWLQIVAHHGKTSLKGLQSALASPEDSMSTVFDYSKCSTEYIQACVIPESEIDQALAKARLR